MQFPALSVGSVWATGGPNNVAWTNSLGHALIRTVKIEIGGQKIDEHYGIWLEIWNELTQVSEKQNGYNHENHVIKSNTSYESYDSFPTIKRESTCGHCISKTFRIPQQFNLLTTC